MESFVTSQQRLSYRHWRRIKNGMLKDTFLQSTSEQTAKARAQGFGALHGEFTVASDFDAPLADDILDDFECGPIFFDPQPSQSPTNFGSSIASDVHSMGAVIGLQRDGVPPGTSNQ